MNQIINTKRYRSTLKWMAISLPWAIIAVLIFPPVGAAFLGGILIWLAVLVFSIWYKAWQAIQDGHARTTPGKAIGYAFIPFFNVYWIFPMIWGFAIDFNHTYHLTHRCHDRRFLLKTIRERNDYRKWLREGARRYGVSIYNYCVTSNHTHMIVHVDDPGAVSSMMQLASATVARHWNRLKGHEGSFWEHPFKCTIVQSGQHLLNCMRYVSLNMVRAGVVGHPSEWRWCGDDELTGRRSRYRLLAAERMLESLDIPSMSAFQRLYTQGIDELLARRQFTREAVWTEALAVGDQLFVETAAKSIGHRQRFTYSDAGTGTPGTVCVHEDRSSYSEE